MKKCDTIQHQGIDNVVLDLSHTTAQQAIDIMAEATVTISKLPPKSVRVFTDATAATYTKDSLAALKNFTTHNTPYIKASALIGTDGLRALALATAAKVTGRTIRTFETRQQTLDWLVTVN